MEPNLLTPDQLWIALKNSAKWLGQGVDLKRPLFSTESLEARVAIQVYGAVETFIPRFKNHPLSLLRRWPLSRKNSGDSKELLYGHYFEELSLSLLLRGRLESPSENPSVGTRANAACFKGVYLAGTGEGSFDTLFDLALWESAYAVLGEDPPAAPL